MEAHLGEELEKYVNTNLPKVVLIRTQRREGLIRARITGAEQATGDVSVNCEQWYAALVVAKSDTSGKV